ncbi:hypothetical protein [uncultured Desulfobacter sp.]|uniref:hypothetical protein n=1 Tax=uncultured Desulfobacter sp. TaxID=240139 RepID=UPI002AAB2837|nr:hypothetical protein [uncultured Desulfobacter sp.]
MKKFGLNLDFDAIRERIEKDKDRYKPGTWAEMVGVSLNVVSNIHGKSKRNPSLEYIVAVSLATGKSVDHYLWGDKNKEEQLEQKNVKIDSTPLQQSIIDEDQDLIKEFKNPEKAKKFNEFLVTVEKYNPDGYDSLYGLAENLYQATPDGKNSVKKTRKIRTGPRQIPPAIQKKSANGN